MEPTLNQGKLLAAQYAENKEAILRTNRYQHSISISAKISVDRSKPIQRHQSPTPPQLRP
jgi:hypothetical protein